MTIIVCGLGAARDEIIGGGGYLLKRKCVVRVTYDKCSFPRCRRQLLGYSTM